MIDLHNLFFLSFMVMTNHNTCYDCPSPIPRFRHEINIYYRVLDDCLIAASNKEKEFQNIYNIESPLTDIKCSKFNPNNHR